MRYTRRFGNSMYISARQLEKFNKPYEKYPFLKYYIQTLEEFFFLQYDNRLFIDSWKKHTNKLWIRNLNRNINRRDIWLVTRIPNKLYLLVQNKLMELTGKYWTGEEFLYLMTQWFVYAYSNISQESNFYKKPLHMPLKKNSDLKKYKALKIKKLKKFNKKFGKYYCYNTFSYTL